MKALVRLAVFCCFLCCSKIMFADSFEVNGSASFDQSNFLLAPPFSNGTDTGMFSTLATGTFYYWLGNTPYVDGVPSTELAFTLKTGTDYLNFYDQANTPTKSIDANGNLVVLLQETGFYIYDGGPAVAGYFYATLTGTSANGTVGNDGTFTAVGGLGIPSLDVPPTTLTGVTPEPTTILFLGTGLLGMAVLLRGHQRRRVAPQQ